MTPIVTPAEMAAIDAAAPEPVEVLIERAGWATARAAIDLLGGTYGRRVVVVAGKGNNGADGRAAARFLGRRGVRTTVVDATDPSPLPAADLIVDAAYGTGFRGTYRHPAPQDADTPVLAVDIPSGIDGLTGIAAGTPWKAIRTVTFAALKPGLLIGDGPDHTGDVTVADIGLDTSGARAHRLGPADLGRFVGDRMRRPRDLHKWRRAARIVAGSPGMTGAAALTAAAALRSGAGYVRLSVPGGEPGPGTPIEVVATDLPRTGWANDVLDDLDRFGALTVGPGLGRDPDTDADVRRVVAEAGVPTLVDGDGIRSLGEAADLGSRLAAREPGSIVLTPHDGEHASLTGAAPEPDRFAAVRSLASTTGAVVLLKGPTTLVAAPSGEVHAITGGDPRLATAGTGDVLSGIVTGLLTAGIEPVRAAAAAAVLHAAAGHLASPRGLIAGDLVDHLPTVLAEAFGD